MSYSIDPTREQRMQDEDDAREMAMEKHPVVERLDYIINLLENILQELKK